MLKDRVFPMPTRWPTYSWYSPANPNGVDMGDDCGQIGGAWDTPYFHCVELLSRLGLQQAVQRAVFRRAEVIHRDQDCLESYYLDGTVDHTRFYNRDQYIVSATAHLSAIIEGLFGITPARDGFCRSQSASQPAAVPPASPHDAPVRLVGPRQSHLRPSRTAGTIGDDRPLR